MVTPVSGVNRWLTLNGKQLSFDPGSENLTAGATEYQYNRLRLTRGAPDGVVIRIDGEPLETEIYGRWTWRPAGFAGLYEFAVSVPGHETYLTHVRVLPNHFSRERHEWMLNDIGKISADLLFQLHSPATERVGATGVEAHYQSPLRTYRLVENLMEELETAIGHLTHMPHRTLHCHDQRQLWHEVATYDASAAPLPGPTIAVSAHRKRLPDLWPREWQVERHVLTYDVYENRLLKHFLWRQLLPRLYELEDSAQNEIRRRHNTLAIIRRQGWEDTETERILELEQVVDICQVMQRRVIGWGNLPFLRHVRPTPQRTVPTQVLQKHPAYSAFYRVYLRFQRELRRGLTADSFLTRIALRKMSELYEVWSVFRMTKLILHVLRLADYAVISDNGFFRVEDQFFHFEVDRGASIELARDSTRVLIRYEPLYPSMHTVPEGVVSARSYQRTPDLAVEVWEGNTARAAVIFDAKYRAEEKDGRRIFWQQDLQKMSAYYSEISWKSRGSRGRPRSIATSAYILYPGDVLEHVSDYPEVGALPFVPGPKQQPAVSLALIDLLSNAGLI